MYKYILNLVSNAIFRKISIASLVNFYTKTYIHIPADRQLSTYQEHIGLPYQRVKDLGYNTQLVQNRLTS